MDVILTHIRNHIAQQDPPFIRQDTAFHVYSLSQKYRLRKEALHAARSTLSFSNLTIEELEDGLDMMPGFFYTNSGSITRGFVLISQLTSKSLKHRMHAGSGH
jgi:hypothetical protein